MNCETDETIIASKIKTWVVNTKIIARYFDPETYDSNVKTMEYTRAVVKNGYLGRATS